MLVTLHLHSCAIVSNQCHKAVDLAEPQPRCLPHAMFPLLRRNDEKPAFSTTTFNLESKNNVHRERSLDVWQRWVNTLSLLESWWLWEAIGVLGSAASLNGIAVILSKYDEKEQPHWQRMSLNTLISWLSTLAKVCVLVPISRGLGQLKWLWFVEEGRALSDLRVFDAASRGVVGSAELVWRLKGE